MTNSSFTKILTQPTGIAVIASIGVHVVLGVALPSLSSFPKTEARSLTRPVELVKLTPIEQSRIPQPQPLPSPLQTLPSLPTPNGSIAVSPPLPATGLSSLPSSSSRSTSKYNKYPDLPPPPPGGFSVPQLRFPPIPRQQFTRRTRLITPRLLSPEIFAQRREEDRLLQEEQRRSPLSPVIVAPSPQPSVANNPNPQPSVTNNPNPQPTANNPQPTVRPSANPQPSTVAANPNASPSPTATPQTVAQAQAQRQERLVARVQEQRRNITRDDSNTSDEEGTKNFTSWLAQLQAGDYKQESIAAQYPKDACLRKLEGTASYGVLVATNGNIASDPVLLKSSGYNIFNQEAIAAIKSHKFNNRTEKPTPFVVNVKFDYSPDVCPALTVPSPTQTEG